MEEKEAIQELKDYLLNVTDKEQRRELAEGFISDLEDNGLITPQVANSLRKKFC